MYSQKGVRIEYFCEQPFLCVIMHKLKMLNKQLTVQSLKNILNINFLNLSSFLRSFVL